MFHDRIKILLETGFAKNIFDAVLIGKGMNQKERMIELRNMARKQIISLGELNSEIIIKKLEYFDDEN